MFLHLFINYALEISLILLGALGSGHQQSHHNLHPNLKTGP